MSRHDQVLAVLTRAGGFCCRPELRAAATDHAIAAAVRDGVVVRLRRGRYALPVAEEHAARAHEMSATLSHLSAAVHWGWKVKRLPDRPSVTVARHRTVSEQDRREVRVCWRDLAAGEVVGGVTSPLRTVLDCALALPFDEALAVADSALRAGAIDRAGLQRAVGRLRGRGRPQALRVARRADGRAANPFESVLRAIALDVPGFDFRPQLQILERTVFAIVDLGDEGARVVLEADSFEWHGRRQGLVRDCERYDDLVVHGWLVLRFTWEQVMFQPDYVRWCLESLLARRLGHPLPPRPATDHTRAA